MSICIFNVCIVLSDFQHRILSPTFPFKLAHSQALTCEFAFASDFIRLYLDDWQKTSQSVFWSYLVLSDISVAAAGAGKGSPSSGTARAGSLGGAVCPGAVASRCPCAAPAPLHGWLRSAVSMGWFVDFFLKPALYSPFHAQFLWVCVSPRWHPGTRAVQGEAGLGRGRGGLSFQHCRLRPPGSSASLPRWP